MKTRILCTFLLAMTIFTSCNTDEPIPNKPSELNNEWLFEGKKQQIIANVVEVPRKYTQGVYKHRLTLYSSGLTIDETGEPVSGKGDFLQIMLTTSTEMLENGEYTIKFGDKESVNIANYINLLEGFNVSLEKIEGNNYSIDNTSTGKIIIKKTNNDLVVDFDFAFAGGKTIKGNYSAKSYIQPTKYEEITLPYIKKLEKYMFSDRVLVSNSSGVIWQSGEVLIFKTSEGNFGKMKIISIDAADNYRLSLIATVFNNDGTVKMAATNNFTIRGTYLCDLDVMTETPETVGDDFHWNVLTHTQTVFDPKNNAKFFCYQFGGQS